MKKEWFEPGPDGESPFVRKYNASPGTAGEAVAAAFRALLAGDEQAAPVDFGNIVQVPEAVSSNVAELIRAKDDEITKLRDEVERLTVELRACKDERMAAEIERDAADEFVKRLTAERDALQASLRDEQAKRASIEAELAACRESRDYLRARIDAGVRVWGSGSVFGGESSRDSSDTHTALLIDARPINQPVDERKAGTIADRGKAS